MKKLVLGVWIVLMAAGCHSGNADTKTIDSGKSNSATVRKTPLQTDYTLNGIAFSDADKMVQRFIGNRGSYDHSNHTCIWFCKEAMIKMVKLASDSSADGVRFYFAKNESGKYTTIVVGTKKGTKNIYAYSGFNHDDYFQSLDPGTSVCNPGSVGNQLGDITIARGATLYNPAGPPCTGLPTCGGNHSHHYLSCTDAYGMIYKNCGSTSVSNTINSTSEWFDLGILKCLVEKIPEKGGLRIYYSKHSAPAPHDNVARHGFVLVLTEPDLTNKIQKDYFACFEVDNCLTYKHFTKQDPGDSGADNGEECPLVCDGATWQ
jgi:hypothetical protein